MAPSKSTPTGPSPSSSPSSTGWASSACTRPASPLPGFPAVPLAPPPRARRNCGSRISSKAAPTSSWLYRNSPASSASPPPKFATWAMTTSTLQPSTGPASASPPTRPCPRRSKSPISFPPGPLVLAPCAKCVNKSSPVAVPEFRMRSLFRFLSVTLALAGAAFAASPKVSNDKPIVNFRVPDFTPEGNRAWLVRGSEARYVGDNQVDVKELNLTIFTGGADGKVETLFLSPAAEIRLDDLIARGPSSIRIINDRFEVTGSDWQYSHKEKKVSIGRNVHVVLQTQVKDILK